MVVECVHISRIKVGDAICDDRDKYFRTVCVKDIKHDSLMGTTIFGNTWNLGRRLVKRRK